MPAPKKEEPKVEPELTVQFEEIEGEDVASDVEYNDLEEPIYIPDEKVTATITAAEKIADNNPGDYIPDNSETLVAIAHMTESLMLKLSEIVYDIAIIKQSLEELKKKE